MNIWIYKNRELLYDDSLTYIEIYKQYNIARKTIKKYQDSKIYRGYYFSTHKLNNEELNNIFSNIITRSNVSCFLNINNGNSSTIDNIKEQVKEIQNKYNILEKQITISRKENKELKNMLVKLLK